MGETDHNGGVTLDVATVNAILAALEGIALHSELAESARVAALGMEDDDAGVGREEAIAARHYDRRNDGIRAVWRLLGRAPKEAT